MPAELDIALVLIVVATATIYLVRRKLRMLKGVHREWTTGHSESCANCGLVKIRKAQLKALQKQS